MDKEFIPYEEALALKELGFDEPCLAYYGELNGGEIELFLKKEFNTDAKYVLTPLYQQAFRWFREKYKLQAEILWRGDMDCFCYKTGKFKQGSHSFSEQDYKTYEEAELACLRKLIEIIKEKPPKN